MVNQSHQVNKVKMYTLSTVAKLMSNHVVVKGDFHIFAHKTGTQQTSLEMPK